MTTFPKARSGDTQHTTGYSWMAFWHSRCAFEPSGRKQALEDGQGLLDGPRPVADAVLLFLWQLGHGAAVAGQVEDWIVAKAAISGRLERDHPLARTLGGHQFPGGRGDGDHAAEAGRAALPGHAAQVGQQRRYPVGVVSGV